jgi:hypothetical protein
MVFSHDREDDRPNNAPCDWVGATFQFFDRIYPADGSEDVLIYQRRGDRRGWRARGDEIETREHIVEEDIAQSLNVAAVGV